MFFVFWFSFFSFFILIYDFSNVLTLLIVLSFSFVHSCLSITFLFFQVARTLVAFEYLWYQAWTQSIETAKAGLQATLIIRHPDDGNLYVNFDQEILQLIREAKCLDRMGVDIPESAKIVLLQEEKFKSYYGDLHYLLKEYDRIMTRILPQTADLLRPHGNDLEYKLRPGMVTLTWTSMVR